MTIKELQAIKADLELKKSVAEQAKGRLEQLMQTLYDEFGCKTLEEAKEKKRQMKEESERLENRISELKESLVKTWEEVNNG